MIRGVFLADGPSDLPLGDHLLSLCVERDVELVLTSVDPHRVPTTGRSVESRLRFLVKESDPFDIAFVHRDAEGEPPESRFEEITTAGSAAGVTAPLVPIVPVRMTEAWLLLDELEIRTVAGKPRSTTPLNLPSHREVERLADPKKKLAEVLLAASCTKGRRRDLFKRDFQRHRALLLSRLDRSGPVTKLKAWQRLQTDLDAALALLGL